ncbi:MAG: cytochrome-c oxidase, cbb3-type subunit III [Rubrivivax sp.]|jgi:cytochrome c oxidase cbb3-type subunit 3
MSDFISGAWSVYVAAATIVALLACLALLIIASRRKVMSDDNSTGHVWDEDLKELNNPLPRWWMGLFVITVVFAGAYLALYPGLGSHPGSLKWSSSGQLQAETDKAVAAMAPVYARYASMSAADLAQEPQAMGIGERLFLNHCAACHGSDGRGSKGFPNLADGDWLWGSSHDAVKEAITHGRNGVMPAMASALGGADDVRDVAHHVLSLSGSTHDSVAAALGKPKFAACAGCHGADGRGNQALGAPNLTDNIWLHGWGEQAIVNIITNGKNNAMPAQASRLTPEQVHVLGAYVLSLSRSMAVASR